MNTIPGPGQILDMLGRARDVGDLQWPLRWRAGMVVYAELHSVTLAGVPAVQLSHSPNSHSTLFGVPLVRDTEAADDHFEIEAMPRDVWVMVLRGKTSRNDRGVETTYPVSPLQDRPYTLTTWPYEDIPNGPRLWTDALQAPLDGLVVPEALPRMPSHHTELMLSVPQPLSVKPLEDEMPPFAARIEYRRFRREQWRNGGAVAWMWRRIT